MAELADLASLALEVQRGGVEEDDVEGAEEILAAMEQLLFNDVFRAAGREGVILLVLGLFPEKGHRPVEMMEGEIVDAGDDVIPMPPVAGPVGAGGEEPMEDREEDCPFHIEAELPVQQEGDGEWHRSPAPSRASRK